MSEEFDAPSDPMPHTVYANETSEHADILQVSFAGLPVCLLFNSLGLAQRPTCCLFHSKGKTLKRLLGFIHACLLTA